MHTYFIRHHCRHIDSRVVRTVECIPRKINLSALNAEIAQTLFSKPCCTWPFFFLLLNDICLLLMNIIYHNKI